MESKSFQPLSGFWRFRIRLESIVLYGDSRNNETDPNKCQIPILQV